MKKRWGPTNDANFNDMVKAMSMGCIEPFGDRLR